MSNRGSDRPQGLLEFSVLTSIEEYIPIRNSSPQDRCKLKYAALNYQQLLNAHKMTVSMSRKGDCYDNALMEAFFSTLKAECATGVYNSRAEAQRSIFEYVEVWYNRQRLHSSLGYASPDSFESAHYRNFNESSQSG